MIEPADKHIVLGQSKFDPEMSLKHFLSSSYLKDTNDFLWMVESLKDAELMGSISFRCKVFNIIYFAIECSLKSLIFSSSGNNKKSEEIYKKIKTHNFIKLIAIVYEQLPHMRRFLKTNENKLLDDANKLGVEVRYCNEVGYLKIHSFLIGKYTGADLLSSTISGVWLTALLILSFKLYAIANKYYVKELKRYSLINGQYIDTYEQRIKEFAKNSGFDKKKCCRC